MLSNAERQTIWEEVRQDLHNCYPDEFGNMPCDNGELCDRCRSQHTIDIFKQRIAKREA